LQFRYLEKKYHLFSIEFDDICKKNI
jgi:hypothetical protein